MSRAARPPSPSPRTTRSTGKVARATTNLRDVNRCRLRPGDRIVHQGYSVLVTDVKEWIGRGLEGFYLHQTRFLSRLHILVSGAPPKIVSANEVDHHSITAYHLAPSPAGEPACGPRPRGAMKRVAPNSTCWIQGTFAS